MSESTTPATDRDLSRLSSRTRTRSKNPAASAKILATGLSATAMLGMTAGYALAARESTPTPSVNEQQGNVSQTTATDGVAPAGGSPALTPLAPLVPPTAAVSPQAAPQVTSPAPAVTAPQATVTPPVAAQVAPQPQVIEIPVETVAPAGPGNGGGGWNNQPSSGSN